MHKVSIRGRCHRKDEEKQVDQIEIRSGKKGRATNDGQKSSRQDVKRRIVSVRNIKWGKCSEMLICGLEEWQMWVRSSKRTLKRRHQCWRWWMYVEAVEINDRPAEPDYKKKRNRRTCSGRNSDTKMTGGQSSGTDCRIARETKPRKEEQEKDGRSKRNQSRRTKFRNK